MSLFIVIPVHNRLQHTTRCLQALEKQLFLHYTIVLVDDGSTDGTAELINSRFPWVHRLAGDGSWWWTRSVNHGIREALKLGASHILLMNNDVWLDPDYLTQLMTAAGTKPGALIGSLNLTMESPHRIFFSGIKKTNRATFRQTRHHRLFAPYQPELKGLPPSAALNGRGTMIPVEVFDRIGFFDEKRMPQYGADFDFAMRARKAGFETLISYHAIVYGATEATGAGKPFVHQPHWQFLKSYLNPYAQTSYRLWAAFVWRHGIKPLFPFTFPLVLIKLWVAHLKNHQNKSA
ncbi:MAG: glycosyltransferase family 2 protein [Breznakibacter sp.]